MSYANEALVTGLLEAATENTSLLTTMEQSPSEAFMAAGMLIPAGTEAEFDAFFREQVGETLASIRAGGVSASALAAASGWGCRTCKIAAWTVAALIVAVGAAALSTLTASSSVVVALASWAGVTANTALVFIQTLGGIIAKGIGEVCKALCGWVGACA